MSFRPKWLTGAPPAPGVYRVHEARSAVWYSRWTGRHWCLGAETAEEAQHETCMREPPVAWAPRSLRSVQRARKRERATEQPDDAWVWEKRPAGGRVDPSPEALALLGWRRPPVE